MKTQLFTLILSLIVLSASAQVPGTPDGNFNKTGFKVFNVTPNVSGAANAVASQPDGKVVIVGTTNMFTDREGYAVRLLPDGTFDSTFHFDGKVTIDMSNEDWDAFHDVVIRPDGKILVAAETKEGGDFDLMLVQFYPDGSLEPNFGSFGISKLDVDPNTEDRPEGIKLLDNGKCLLFASSYGANQNQRTYVIRFNENGSIDKSFGVNGFYTWDESHNVYIRDIVILPDNKIILGGQTKDNDGHRLALIGLTEDGQLDLSFGNGGMSSYALTPSQADLITSLHLTPDNSKIMACGQTSGASLDIWMARFSLSGGLDLQFGNGGYKTSDLSIGGDDYAFSSVMQSDGKMIVSGVANDGVYTARYHPDGTLDYSFNATGYWMYDLNPGGTELPWQIILDANDRAVMVGSLYKANMYSSFAIALHVGAITTGIREEVLWRQSMDIFPNPSNGEFRIKLNELEGPSQFTIIDMQGKIIANGIIPNLNLQGSLSINGTSWPNGQYIIQVTDGNKILTGNLIKQ